MGADSLNWRDPLPDSRRQHVSSQSTSLQQSYGEFLSKGQFYPKKEENSNPKAWGYNFPILSSEYFFNFFICLLHTFLFCFD